MISLNGRHIPRDAVLYAVCYYLRYTVSYRNLEEIMAERGVRVDQALLNRWVVKYSPMLATRTHSKKRPTKVQTIRSKFLDNMFELVSLPI